VQEEIRSLHPERRRKVRAAIDALREDPSEGKALQRELVGLWRYPLGALRIVYRFDDEMLEIVAVAPRATVYEDLARRLGESRARYVRRAAQRGVPRRLSLAVAT
jgi:mRNA-degrading endonuclease RelE of RelBE toxin-antitoxin system